jgi:hypothetical protein
LRFDETPLDAGRESPNADDAPTDSAGPPDGETDGVDALDGAGDGPADASSCIDAGNASCGWRMSDCEPNGDDRCEQYCPAALVCTNGTCGTGCVADCQQNSTCSVTAGDISRLECKAGATCTATLGAGANAVCATGSVCQIRCTGRCALSCQVGATCQLRCGDGDFTTVTGTASCP